MSPTRTDEGTIGRGIRRLAMTLPELRAVRRIYGIEKLFVGMEADVWSFSVESDGANGTQSYVLKLFARADGGKVRDEMETMEAVRTAAIACPRPVACSEETAVFGCPFLLMEKIEGRPLKNFYYEASEDERERVVDTFSRIFADLHRADWRPARDALLMWDEDDPYGYLLGLLPGLLDQIKRLGIPGFVPVWNWLGEHLYEVPCRRPTILHGDFHPGNILMPPDGPPVIIDWGGAMVGDRRRDVAWSLLLIDAESWGLRDRVLDEYTRRFGEGLDGFEYFEVLASLVRLLLVADSWEYFLDRYRERREVDAEAAKLQNHVLSIRRLIRRHTGIEVAEMDRVLESLRTVA